MDGLEIVVTPTRLLYTVTNNEDYVRLRVYDGDLKVDDAAAELIRIAQAQAAAEEACHAITLGELWAAREELAKVCRELEEARANAPV